jgi:hypothetical protein
MGGLQFKVILGKKQACIKKQAGNGGAHLQSETT